MHKPLLKPVLMLAFILLFVLNSFIPLTILPPVLALLMSNIFLLSFKDLKPLNRWFVSILLGLSVVLAGSNWQTFSLVSALLENAGIVSLLLTAPLLGFMLAYAPYDQLLIALFNRFVQTRRAFYSVVLILAAVFCSLMGLAAIPFIKELLAPLSAKYPPAIFYQALTRGFAANLFWSPNLVTVAVILRYIQISWYELLSAGIWFSLLSLGIAWLVGRVSIKESEAIDNSQLDRPSGQADFLQGQRYLLVLLTGQISLVLGALLVLTQYVQKSIFAAMPLIAFIIPLVLAVVAGKFKLYQNKFKNYVTVTLPPMANECLLFISIGIFGYALANAADTLLWQQRLSALISDCSPVVLAVTVIGIVSSLSMIGIHPMITISSVAVILQTTVTGFSSLQWAIILITSYSLYLFLSPFSSVVMLLSALTGESVYKLGIKLNARYCVLWVLVIIIVVCSWQYQSG